MEGVEMCGGYGDLGSGAVMRSKELSLFKVITN